MSTATIIISPEAELDFDRFLASLEERSKRAAARSRGQVERMLRLLAADLEGREVPLLDGRRVRRWVVGGVVVYYVRTAGTLEVVRIHPAKAAPIEDT